MHEKLSNWFWFAFIVCVAWLCLVLMFGWLKLTLSINNIAIIQSDQIKNAISIRCNSMQNARGFYLGAKNTQFSHYNQPICGMILCVWGGWQWKYQWISNFKIEMIKISHNRMDFNQVGFSSSSPTFSIESAKKIISPKKTLHQRKL